MLHTPLEYSTDSEFIAFDSIKFDVIKLKTIPTRKKGDEAWRLVGKERLGKVETHPVCIWS